MIVGSGMLARAFSKFDTNSDIVIFASGVSDSLETNQSQYQREFDLLKRIRSEHPHSLLVYFSTCSIVDPDRKNTSYVRHKIMVEESLMVWGHPFLNLRLPAVIGCSNVARTLPFFLKDKIKSGETFDIWTKAIRYPIDIDDVVRIGSIIIDNNAFKNMTINVALKAYSIPEIVLLLEELLGHQAFPREIDRGSSYGLNLSISHQFADQLGIDYHNDYLKNVLKKYF